MSAEARRGKRMRVSRSSGEAGQPSVQPSLLATGFVYGEAEHCEFNEKGFIGLPCFLAPAAVKALREVVDGIFAEKVDEVDDEWVMSPHQQPHGELLWQLATEPALLDMLEQHLGPDIVLFSLQLAVKRPRGGRPVPWHQDGPPGCRTVWIPLDAVTASSGALQLLPCRHTQGRLPYRPVATHDEVIEMEFYDAYHLYRSDVGSVQPGSEVSCDIPAGGLELHHPQTPHSSGINHTASWRRAIIIRYQKATEPVVTGTLRQWRDGKLFTKENYLVRGNHPLLPEGSDESPGGELLRCPKFNSTHNLPAKQRSSVFASDDVECATSTALIRLKPNVISAQHLETVFKEFTEELRGMCRHKVTKQAITVDSAEEASLWLAQQGKASSLCTYGLLNTSSASSGRPATKTVDGIVCASVCVRGLHERHAEGSPRVIFTRDRRQRTTGNIDAEIFIWHLWVRPSARGGGRGRRLVDAVTAHARTELSVSGAVRLAADVLLVNTDALGFWRHVLSGCTEEPAGDYLRLTCEVAK